MKFNRTTLERASRRIVAVMMAALQTGIATSASVAGTTIESASERPTVFFIHDVHAHAGAQASIAALVDALRRKAPVGFIGLEGAFEPVNVDRLRAWNQREAAVAVADFLMKEKLISGPIQAAVAAEAPLPPLYGVDDRALYDANVGAYRSAAPLKKRNQDAVDAARAAFAPALSNGLSKSAAELRASINAHRDGAVSLDGHLALLQKAGVTLTENLRSYQFLRAAERASDPAALKREQARLSAALARKLPLNRRSELMRLAADLAHGEVKVYHARLASLCEMSGVSISDYPAIESHAKAVDAAAKLDVARLETDLESLDAQAVDRVATPAEKELLAQDRYLSLSGKLLSFSLTRAEWDAYAALKAGRSPVAPDASAFEKFYEAAASRDEAIARRTVELTRRTGMGGIIVAGGFHAQGLTRALESAGVSVKAIYPTFSMEDVTSGSDYLERFNTPLMPAAPLLLASANTLAPAPAEGLPLAPFLGATLIEALSPAKSLTAQTDFAAVQGRTDVSAETVDSAPGAAQGRFSSPERSVELDLTADRDSAGRPRILSATFRERAQAAASLIANAARGAAVVGANAARTILILGTPERPTSRALVRGLPIILAAALVGCQAPQPASKGLGFALPTTYGVPSASDNRVINGWISTFGDKRLESLVDEAMRNNPDLQVAAARYDAARALNRQARSSLFPEVSAEGGYTRGATTDHQRRDPEVFVNPGPWKPVNDQNLDPGSDTSSRRSDFIGTVGTSWELDVWGRVRAGARATAADAEALAAAYAHARQSLAAEVARNYFVLIEARLQSDRAKADIARLEGLAKLATERNEAGIGRKSDSMRARAELAVAQDRLRVAQAAQEKSARGLELLTRRYPSAEIATASKLPSVPSRIAAGVPSELLRRRWDLVSAEIQVAAQTHRVRQAYASRFPRFTLDLSAGASVGGAGLIESGYSVGANVLAPLLDWGRRLAAENAASAIERAAVAQYVSAVNSAFAEVENSLSNVARYAQREALLEAAVEARREDVSAIKQRVELGVSSMEEVFDAERRLSETEALYLAVRSLRLQNIVDLHLSVGGDFAGRYPRVPSAGAAPSETDGRTVDADPLPSKKANDGTPAPEDLRIPLPTGGAWFSHPAYLRFAWLETPVVYALSIIAYVGAVALFPQLALLPATVGGALAAAPVLFVAGHRLGNPAATFSKPVMALAGAKAVVAILTVAAVSFSPTIGAALFVPLAGAGAITLWHYLIQRNVLAIRASAESRTAAAALRRLIAQPASESRADRASRAMGQAYGNDRAAAPRALSLAATEIAAKGRRPGAPAIQSALQSAVADSGVPASEPTATEGLPQNRLSIIVIDRGASAAVREHALARAEESAQQEGRQVVVVTDGADSAALAQAGLKQNSRVAVFTAGAAFDENGLALSALNSALSKSGFFGAAPTVDLMARADLPIIPDGLDPTSALARAIILLINRDLQAVSVTLGGLSRIAEVARLVAQQA